MTNAQIQLDLKHWESLDSFSSKYALCNISVTLDFNNFWKVKIHQNQCRGLKVEVYFAISLNSLSKLDSNFNVDHTDSSKMCKCGCWYPALISKTENEI